MTETGILAALDSAVWAPHTRRVLKKLALDVVQRLAHTQDGRLAWRTVPLEVYGELPAGISSSWVFVLRRGSTSGAERHPNSVQRVMSLGGAADLQTWNGQTWVSHPLTSEPAAPIEGRWLSIPERVWHKPVMGSTDWVVVSFHTATAEALIEELAENDDVPDAAKAPALYEGRSFR